MRRFRSLLTAGLLGLLTFTGAAVFTPVDTLAAGGLSWSQPQPVLTLEGGASLIWASNLIVDGGKEYWVYVDSSANPWLATDAGGTWRNYGLGIQGLEHSGATTPLGSIAVQNGVVYVPYLDGSSGSLDLAYNPSGNPSGPWVQVPVVPANTSGALCGLGTETENPSAAIAGSNLYVSFQDGAPCNTPGAGQVYMASIALSSLSQSSGGSPSWSIQNISAAQGNSTAPAITSDGQTVSLAWDYNGGSLQFMNDVSSGQSQSIFAAPTDFYGHMQLAAGSVGGGSVHAVALYAGGNSSTAYAATDAGGSWSSAQLGPTSGSGVNTSSGQDDPAAAIGFCGVAVAYNNNPTSNFYTGDTVYVATYAGGQWNPVAVGSAQNNPLQLPALAPIPGGFDLLYVNNDGASPALYAATGTCPPVVTGVIPSSGPAAGATTLTISGRGFTGATAVDFQGSAALGDSGYGPIAAQSFTVVSDTEITAVTPQGSGTVDVTVTTPAGTSAVSSADRFSYAGAGQGGSSGSGSSGSAPGFSDLTGYSYAAQAIDALAAQGIIKGTGPDTFDPGGEITRAQFALLMQRTFTPPAPSQPIAFADVPQSSVAYAAVEALAPYMDYYQVPGGGYAFHPTQYVDRLDAATVMVKMLAATGKLSVLSPDAAQAVLAHVTDASSIAPALQIYAATALKAGLIAGYSDGSFRPQVILVRAQVAVLIWRLQNLFLTTSPSP